MLDKLAKEAHKSWIRAMKRGDAPPEDVSHGEGFAICSMLVKDLKNELKAMKKDKGKSNGN